MSPTVSKFVFEGVCAIASLVAAYLNKEASNKLLEASIKNELRRIRQEETPSEESEEE